MSPVRKSDDVLNEWSALAGRAVRPARAPRGSSSRSPLKLAIVGLVALLIVAAVIAPRALGPTGPATGASPSATVSIGGTVSPPTAPEATASQVAPSATAPGTAPAGSNPTFTTNGVATNWKGFSWSPIPPGTPDESPLFSTAFYGPVVRWTHGYAMVGQPLVQGPGEEVWTSPDGTTWTRTLQAPYVQVAEAPHGLVAITVEGTSEGAGQTAWSSPDGTHWTNLGIPRGVDMIVSLAGTPTGLVAVSRSGSNQDQVVVSTDGLTWSPATVEQGLQWDDYGATVEAANGRFFLMGGLAPGSGLGPNGIVLASSTGTGQVFWSDDGKNWHRSAVSTGGYGTSIDSAAGGLILHTNYRATPGGVGMAYSTDGGKTWVDDPKFGPLGEQVCQGECGIGPDGVIGSNGELFLAVRPDGHAWTSTDGKTWTSIAWDGPLTEVSLQNLRFLPRGVLTDGKYGAAK
jgi:hypothetical protein